MGDHIRRVVIVGGMGEVGRFFAKLLAGGATVTLVDPRAAARPGVSADDVRVPGAALMGELARADLVVLAVPESVAVAAVPVVASVLPPGALLVDTLSVKAAIVPVLRHAATRHGLAALSVNPMFAPALGAAGRPVAVVEVVPGGRVARLRELLTGAGAALVPMTVDRHDRLCAAVQVATHASVLAFGAAVRSMDIDPADLLEVAPPPHRTMLGLLARLVSASPEVYRDIQVANPDADAVRSALGLAVDQLRDATGTPERFAAHVGDLADWLGPHRAALAAECAAAFAGTTRSARIDEGEPAAQNSGTHLA